MNHPRPTLPPHKDDHRNMLIALVLTVLVIIGWKVLYENPRQEQLAAYKAQQEALKPATPAPSAITPHSTAGILHQSRSDALKANPRVRIASHTLHGSINLKGARLDDLTLAQYRETVKKDSPEVVLLSPRIKGDGYFAEFGWAGANVTLPTNETLWEASSDTLTPDAPVTLHWVNPEGVRFEQTIALDAQYLFTVTVRVVNATATPLTLSPYSLINRTHNVEETHYAIMHQGLLGVSGETLQEHDYSEVREAKVTDATTPAWAGITDKYWLTSLIPERTTAVNAKTTYQYYETEGDKRYQVDMLSAPITVGAGATEERITRFFAGAKLVDVLDGYAEKYNITMFDRAVDFGSLYFLTRPLFAALTFFHNYLGNMGLAIMALTVCVKLVLFPLANKSYSAMSQMKLLTPKMKEIRERYEDDRMRMNQEIMALYKEEGVNPASGCLPLLIQMPIFFALYKVMFITIEMRHAPFYGWLRDLSAIDPTNIFTAFGLIAWNPPTIMHVGVLPLVMMISMIIQQRMSPKPADPTQAQVMMAMPYIFLFVFASFPAGLVLYWAWNNVLSIAQQWLITKRYEKLYDKETGKRLKPNRKQAA
jgi:YidC/Oxa1 family membrane protein insertase